MKEIVPFERIYMAPPSGKVEQSDYLSYEDYEKVSEIKVDRKKQQEYNLQLLEKWREEQKQ